MYPSSHLKFNLNLNLLQGCCNFGIFELALQRKSSGKFSLQLHINPVLTPIQWSNPAVIISITLACILAILFFIVEIFFAPEPVLAPSLLKQKIPLLVGVSNILVSMCNFSIMYFFPMWFQTVMLTNASTAGMRMFFSLFYFVNPTKKKLGLHLLPNSLSMSTGPLFAGWMMHATGRYKTINLIFGAFPFIGAVLMYRMKEDSSPIQSWLSIVR